MNISLAETELPIRISLGHPVTDEELLRLSAANELLRIERDPNGELIVMSPAGSDAGSTELNVGAELRIWARADGTGKAFGPNAGFTMPDSSVRAADAAWVSWTRWNALSRQQQVGFAPICPEFVIEVRSESDRLPPLREKMEIWIANGAELAWLIDPSRRAVEIYRTGREAEFVEGASAVEGEGPVSGFVLELARVWD
jgi:Uma2 family endonuclease